MVKKGKKKSVHAGSNLKTEKPDPTTRTNRNHSKAKKGFQQSFQKKRNSWGDTQLYAAVEADGQRSIVKMADDGNCLFRAISDQLYYDYGEGHGEVRSEVCDYLEAHEKEFSCFLVLDETEVDEDAADFASYVRAMRQDGEWGGNLELVVAARLYRRNIVVFSASLAALTIDHGSTKKPAGLDMLISYHDNQHYNSVRDNSAPRPKPPYKSLLKEACDETPQKHSESSPCNDGDSINVVKENGVDTNDEAAQQYSNDKLTKNSSCPCGSGLRYKKCCLAKKKHESRVLRLRGVSTQEDAKDDEECEALSGGFRVLKI